jgi:hypothetical protein
MTIDIKECQRQNPMTEKCKEYFDSYEIVKNECNFQNDFCDQLCVNPKNEKIKQKCDEYSKLLIKNNMLSKLEYKPTIDKLNDCKSNFDNNTCVAIIKQISESKDEIEKYIGQQYVEGPEYCEGAGKDSEFCVYWGHFNGLKMLHKVPNKCVENTHTNDTHPIIIEEMIVVQTPDNVSNHQPCSPHQPCPHEPPCHQEPPSYTETEEHNKTNCNKLKKMPMLYVYLALFIVVIILIIVFTR